MVRLMILEVLSNLNDFIISCFLRDTKMLRACSTRHVRRDSGNFPCSVLRKLGEVLAICSYPVAWCRENRESLLKGGLGQDER